ncbi:alpha-N-arabinofuranosidase [Parvularcula sp. LCG005]|uniref:alpha-N-arabinofuranosidase n=1 Tax=Parvularcula sp. LCG005 TaxID=3078805 RepID=UPI0029423D2F|nr:alpha-L-arabinofuranosidase C-terminal domain-containing protein [Parvularcula sp. LCG005]WOI52606.1 alpha-L-arabinofuranosidase C-terminal domain-containing protein [Parvularcula sp. LCG005]
MRKFATAISALATLTALPAFAQTELTINTDSEIGVIQPEVYGQFLEHLGGQPYDSIWVGKKSKIPNTDGIRNDVFDALDKLDIPVIRWPGGCYADLYHWRDGVGSKRAGRTNMAWGGTPEPNTFGTHEFFNLAERLGAKTYLNVNLGTGTLNEATDWLEYITFDGKSDLADERRANGRAEPWKIDYLSVGNETWGCGGHLRPDAYADLYALWATFLKTSGEQPKRVISGSHEGNIDYSKDVLDHPNIGSLSEGISLHYYTLPTGDWGEKGDALDFPEEEWASTIRNTLRIKPAIDASLAMIDEHELGDDFGLYVDEWGMWVDGEEGAPALYQQNTIRDAVVAALNFNIFHDYADRVPMTNIAQMVNVLQAMILVDGPDMVLTPTYHVFEMYTPFQGATALEIALDSPSYTSGDISFPALSATAARTPEGEIVIGLVNADPKSSHDVSLPASGAATLNGRVLTAARMDGHNTFDDKTAVVPTSMSVSAENDIFTVTLPAHSVVVLTME